VSDTLDSDHLPITFHILDHVRIRDPLAQVEKFTDWDRFRSLTTDPISPKLKINSEIEADKAARDFTASIASAYKLSTYKSTLYGINNNPPGLDRLLREKQRLRKLWQETRDPACKTAVNWVSRAIRRMAQKKALERREAKLCNCEVTPQAVWPIAKSLLRRDEPKAPTAIHGPSGLKFYPKDKANVIADCLEKQFTPHELCDENHERRVEARIQALHEAVDENAQPN
jgi:hypothetical protein